MEVYTSIVIFVNFIARVIARSQKINWGTPQGGDKVIITQGSNISSKPK